MTLRPVKPQSPKGDDKTTGWIDQEPRVSSDPMYRLTDQLASARLASKAKKLIKDYPHTAYAKLGALSLAQRAVQNNQLATAATGREVGHCSPSAALAQSRKFA
jgi:hypothetical protein